MSRRIQGWIALILSLVVGADALASGEPCEPTWERAAGQPGVVGLAVEALVVFDDGNGPALYAGGTFSSAGGVAANNIAKWNGTSWSPLGLGTDGTVYALAVYNDGTGPALYAGGFFLNAGGLPASFVAKWNGTTWSSLGVGTSGVVYALGVFNGDLYVGGGFLRAGGIGVSNIAKWDGENWGSLGLGTDRSVNTLAAWDDGTGSALFVGGDFTSAGGLPARRIAKWTGSAWDILGGGLGDLVFAMVGTNEVSRVGPALYVGGSFTSAAGGTAPYIARWDGTRWSALDPSPSFNVLALALFNDGTGPAIYAGGTFLEVGKLTVNHIAKWDGLSWSPLGSGVNDEVWALLATDEEDGLGGARLYAGGDFSMADGGPAAHIAAWATSCSVGDCNGDDDVDLGDFSDFPDCMLGPSQSTPPGCECADINGNGHVDLADMRVWQIVFTGP
ncbi:MAG: hypothetical protein PVI86_09420 [Phycisphaerae bacterium]|jgi:hypothetical protein